MTPQLLIASFYVFVLAAFLGYQVISRVPPLLHTPLMSATNAISAISIVGALVIAGLHNLPIGGTLGKVFTGKPIGNEGVATLLGTIAVISAMTNVVGGFMITDRMLKMFRKKEAPAGAEVKK